MSLYPILVSNPRVLPEKYYSHAVFRNSKIPLETYGIPCNPTFLCTGYFMRQRLFQTVGGERPLRVACYTSDNKLAPRAWEEALDCHEIMVATEQTVLNALDAGKDRLASISFLVCPRFSQGDWAVLLIRIRGFVQKSNEEQAYQTILCV